MPLLEWPHWLMVAGAFLVVFGLTGLAFNRRSKAEIEPEAEPEVLPGDLGAWKAEQARSASDHDRHAA
ncbi:hypothetical protein JQ604_39555 [Bradyrhizobium jicamae]|uniref:hypothetical protein n=1 Tax=Bradyrhizobium jicamae TaxID=280332 RepID=UPI001BA91CE5|nr:hypothetical protein [Bradyrhizobium jicamae]MBR0758311.1 hypothetical protein [Bradyrhizobium jicamae]